jgi:hypothetical protein
MENVHGDHSQHSHHSAQALLRAKTALPRSATTRDLVNKYSARVPTVGPGSTVLAAAGLATLAARKAQRALELSRSSAEVSSREATHTRCVVEEEASEASPSPSGGTVRKRRMSGRVSARWSARFSRIRRSTKIAAKKTQAAPPTGAVLTAVIEMNGGKLTLDCDTLVQHTVIWSEPIPVDDDIDEDSVLLRAGSINLYKFPLVTPHTEAGLLPLPDVMPNAAEMRHLEQLVTALMNDEASRFSMAADVTGAKPIHALLISNTECAVGLCLELIKQRPERMLEAHGAGDFEGENCMHVLCVQQREDILCRAFDVVARHLPRAEVRRLLTMQASGTFFRKPPVDLYGSTPLSCVATAHAACPTSLVRSARALRGAACVALTASRSRALFVTQVRVRERHEEGRDQGPCVEPSARARADTHEPPTVHPRRRAALGRRRRALRVAPHVLDAAAEHSGYRPVADVRGGDFQGQVRHGAQVGQ